METAVRIEIPVKMEMSTQMIKTNGKIIMFEHADVKYSVLKIGLSYESNCPCLKRLA